MASEPLPGALDRVRTLVLDQETLVKAVASGRRQGTTPPWRRAELRYVDLKAGRRLQVTTYDATQAFTANHPVGETGVVDELLEQPFANWTVATTTEVHQVQVRTPRTANVTTRPSAQQQTRTHDKQKARLLPEDDPVFVALGIADKDGRLKPSRQAKYRQVEEFLRLLDTAIDDALRAGALRRPTVEEPLRIVDLGCGNGYLTFAAQRYLTAVKGIPVVVTGVDVKEQSRDHNRAVARELGRVIGHCDAEFVAGTISEAVLPEPPEVVLALHACDTATDDALARAVAWAAPLVLAAPCCHHDIAAQLRNTPTPAPYAMLTRHGILRERLADTLTDALRASLLRISGYRVDVVQFVESQHTPRNTMLRAVRTGGPVEGGAVRSEYDDMVAAWGIRPRLGELLGVG
ncbi:class I SAM-dependent methyltransferase [Nocardioides sp.]|uniref:class I SAM-dependent methyltransferase n=1 Tax=Nocardioides sp. TaxID=35761 RepID=UPI0039E427EB